ncbi:MAG: histidine kinase [endosymbiont of Seepiophila jonesi]|uniref:histidine kinase n=1 Tax=endosymbiont of Lamellibrachia luymesi TaxID=2200907 RepID=A0A370DX34_9GAMM|nr:MAG: histidine kinase [endosymbiont of Lamellibrachia luymesi]RDH91887.1 MAG: histidine kinase [endosymbiont of Seepiophila jonesi]
MSAMDESAGALREKERELEVLREQMKSLQAQLIQSEKMAGLGTLAAGVAHELNNPIGFVKNNLISLREYLAVLLPVLSESLAFAETDQGEELRRCFGDIAAGEDLAFLIEDVEPLLKDAIEGGVRLEQIVDGLKRFARHDDTDGELFDLNQCVQDTLKVGWNELKYKAKVHHEAGRLLPLHGRPGEISQVILNLLLNAVQAIPEFGEINIDTLCRGDEVVLRITDNGEGIPAENLDKLFRPFFTTKAKGKGSGLGLSISHGIIEDHGGRIDVESDFGKGSTFTLYLPVYKEQSLES